MKFFTNLFFANLFLILSLIFLAFAILHGTEKWEQHQTLSEV